MSKLGWQKSTRYATDLTHAEFRVLTILVTFTDENLGNAFPGQDRLFEAACVSVPTGKKALKSLIEKGWIVLVEEGGNQHWKGKANVYAVTTPKGASELPPSDIPKGANGLPPSPIPKGVSEFQEGGKSGPQGGKSLTPHQVINTRSSTSGPSSSEISTAGPADGAEQAPTEETDLDWICEAVPGLGDAERSRAAELLAFGSGRYAVAREIRAQRVRAQRRTA